MLGHRTLTPEDYLDILKRRFWTILIPVVLFPILATAITFFIAPEFLSQTLVIIDRQKVPGEYVTPVVSSDVDSRLASMKEEMLSRSRLQPIIDRYNLYGNRRITADDRIDLVRKDINIKPIHSEIARTGGLPGFFILFRASDARTAQLACGDITSLFLSANLKSREDSAVGTTDFLKNQLADAKRDLDQQDAKLAAFQRQYIGRLPGETTPNVNMLTSLNTQLEAANQALSRMEQDKSYGESMLAQQVQLASTAVAAPAATQTVTPKAQEAELQTLLEQEAELTNHYTDDHPDVIAVRRKIAVLRKKMAEPVAAPVPVVAAPTNAPKRPESQGILQMRAQLKALELGIQSKRAEQAQLQGNIRMYQDRIQSSPLVEEQYKELTRDYDSAEKFYNDLLTKMNHSKMATDLERAQQGEQFRIMDEPNLPDGPTFPKRWVFFIGGLCVGLVLGLGIVALLEYRDTALRTERDVWAFTKLPTLAVIGIAEPFVVQTEKRGFKNRFKRKAKIETPAEVFPAAGPTHV
jgi:polysaccharide chain length determinant protein (PEP-CTERM system associated)